MIPPCHTKLWVLQSRQNKCDFGCLMNCLYVTSGCRSKGWSLFHSRAAADWKQRSPRTSEQWRWRQLTAVISWQSLVRNGDSRAWIALYTNSVNSSSARCLMGSQCSCCRTVTMWLWRWVPDTRHAAAFCADWRRWIKPSVMPYSSKLQ